MPASPAPRKPRLLLVTHYFPAHRGGVEIVAHELARRLAADFELHWLAADCDPPPELPGALIAGQPAWNGLERRLGLPWPVWGWRGWRALARAVRAADAVHIHDFIYPSSLAALLLARRFGKPLVVTQHIGDIDYRNPLLRAVLRGVNRSLGRLALGRADQTVFISPRVRALFEGFTRFRAPPEYWPNGVDTRTYAPAANRQALRQQLGVADGQRVVLFVGRFVEKKGLPVLRELARLRPDWQWWFAGWGSPGPQHPGSWALPQVKVWEGRSGAALAALYQAADVLVLPSYGEGFPLVVQESLACGTPAVISADTAAGGPPVADIIRPVPHRPEAPRPDDWLAALARVIDASAAERDALRANAARFAAAEWNWDRLAERYAALFARLHAGRR